MANEARVKELIQEALDAAVAPNGTVFNAITKAINESVDQGGAILGAIQANIHASLGENGAVAAKILSAFDDKCDQEFPCGAKLRALTPAEWDRAWKMFVVDPDEMGALASSMANPAMVNIVGLSAAHPENVELQNLKQATAMKYAGKVGWKGLCLPAFGGGPDKLQVFLTERAASPDAAVKALARSLQVLYHLVEKRYTVLQSAKKHGPLKAAQQRDELMVMVYFSIKAYKHRSIKATAMIPLETNMLMHDFGVDLVLGQTALLARGEPLPPAAGGGRGSDAQAQTQESSERPAKAARLESHASPGGSAGGQGSAAGQGAAAAQSNADSKKQLVKALTTELTQLARSKKAPQIQAWIDRQFAADDAHRAAMTSVLKEYCKNCVLSNRGMQKHSLKKCRELNNACVLLCPKCTSAGRTRDITHWAADCPH